MSEEKEESFCVGIQSKRGPKSIRENRDQIPANILRMAEAVLDFDWCLPVSLGASSENMERAPKCFLFHLRRNRMNREDAERGGSR